MPNVISTPARGTNFGFLVSEADGYLSREEAVVASGSGVLVGGTIMGRVTAGAASTPVVTTNPDNIGNGTVGSLAGNTGEEVGNYQLYFTDATHYEVRNPRMETVGHGTVGTAYTGEGPGHTITAGSVAFRVGDFFEVSAGYASGGTFKPLDPAASDGSQNFAGILTEDVDATSAAVKRTMIVRIAEVQRSQLVFATAATGVQRAAVYAAMASASIALR